MLSQTDRTIRGFDYRLSGPLISGEIGGSILMPSEFILEICNQNGGEGYEKMDRIY